MPEDISSLLVSFGVDPNSGTPDQDPNTPDPNVDPNAAPAAPDPNADQDPNKDPDPSSDPAKVDDSKKDQDPNLDPLKDAKVNQAFAEMRSENAKYKKFMQTLMRGTNYTGDEAAFMGVLTDEAYKKQAQVQGMAANPDILKKLDTYEAQLKELEDRDRNSTLLLGLKNLQQANGLTGPQVEQFVKRAIDNKVDLLTPGLSFDVVYKGLFYKEIHEKELEAARQEWIRNYKGADDAANPDGKSGKGDPKTTEINTQAELNSLLSSIPKDLK